MSGPLLLFDGSCVLCHRSVRFILRHEHSKVLRFAALESETGRAQQNHYDIPPQTDAMILIENGHAYWGSDAALRLCRYLRYPWRMAYPLRGLPGWMHRPLYRWIARHRYRWFGRDESCPLPDPDQAKRFLG